MEEKIKAGLTTKIFVNDDELIEYLKKTIRKYQNYLVVS